MKKIQSIERGMLLLTLLDTIGGKEGLGVGKLAALANLKPPTVHNILQTFLLLGYVEQTDSSRYRIGEKTKYLGWEGAQKEHLLHIVRPVLRSLASITNETCLLAARSGEKWQTLLKMESDHILSAKSALPMTDNFYISATGRCILANLKEEELFSYVQKFRLPTSAEWQDITSFPLLQEALAKIRERNYEIYLTKHDGITGIGSALKRHKNIPDAALGIIVPDSRFLGRHREMLMEELQKGIEKINTEVSLS